MKMLRTIRQIGRGVFCKHLYKQSIAGCTKAQLRKHIELQFKEGMSWDNYGEWEIDHITPVTFFDLSKDDEYLACAHFSNLQPLWKNKNRSKRNRVGGKRIVAIHNRRILEKVIDFNEVLEVLKREEKSVVLSKAEAFRFSSFLRHRGHRPIMRIREDKLFRVWFHKESREVEDASEPILMDFFSCGDWGFTQ